jgi:hypothetical protein
MDEAERRALIRRYWENTTGDQDQDITHEIYHEDAVLEFPQSGERFEGVAQLQGVAKPVSGVGDARDARPERPGGAVGGRGIDQL